MTDAPKLDSLLSAEDNRSMFDRVARRYDLLNSVLSLGLDGRWRRKAIAALAPRPAERFLDVGCGTGGLALEIIRQSPQSSVTGIDPAQEMLKIAAAKVARAGAQDRIELIARDALAMDFPSESPAVSLAEPFDGVVSGFCLRNITHRLQALRHMRCILRPAGRIVILELTRPSSRLARLGHRIYNRTLVPLVGRLLSHGDAYRYLAESIEDFPRPEAIVELMCQAGFEQARFRPLSGGVVCLFIGQCQVK